MESVVEHGIRDTRTVEPSFREAGAGPGVVCIHANASTGAQWRGLMDLIAPRFRVFAPDSYDAGKSRTGPRIGSSAFRTRSRSSSRCSRWPARHSRWLAIRTGQRSR